MKKGLSILILVTAFIIGAIGTDLGKGFSEISFSLNNPSEEEIKKKLAESFQKAANQINASAPAMIDNETRMDKATVGPGAILTYHYTFPNYSAVQLDKSFILNELRSEVTTNVCNSKKMESTLKYGGRYIYSYSGTKGVHIAEFEVSGSHCGY